MPGLKKLLSFIFRRLPPAIKESRPVHLIKMKLSPGLPTNNFPNRTGREPSCSQLIRGIEKEMEFSADRIQHEKNKAVRDYHRGRKDALYFIYNSLKSPQEK